MHGSDLDHMSCLFALENAIPLAASHTGHVKELGTIDHVVIYRVSFDHIRKNKDGPSLRATQIPLASTW